MEKTTFLKTLLMAVMLLRGANFAWATEPDTDGYSTVYTNDFESGSDPWGWTGGTGAAYPLIEETGGNHFLSVTRSGNNYNKALPFTKNYSKYDLTFKWYAKTTKSTSSKVQLKFARDYSNLTGTADKYQFRFNDEASATSPTLRLSIGSSKIQEITNYTQATSAPTSVSSQFYTVRVASDGVNVRFTFTNPESVSVTYDVAYSSDLQLGGILMQSNTVSTDVLYIDDIVLKVPTENYTINYKLGDDIIKTETGTAADGATISATLPFTKDAQKYYAQTNETTTSWTKSGEDMETFNVPLRLANTYSILVTAKGAGDDKELCNVSGIVEGESYTVPYPRYYNVNGTLYEADKTDSKYAKVFSNLSADQNVDVNYSASSKTNIANYTEGEDITGVYETWGTFANQSSNGKGGATSKYSVDATYKQFVTLPAGKYTVTMRVIGKTSKSYYVAKDSEGTNKVLSIENTASSTVESTSSEFTLDSETSLYVKGGYQTTSDQAYFIDYVYVQQTAVSKTITAAGWATYCSPYPLDFSEGIENLTDVYIITGSQTPGAESGYVAKTSVNGGTVPANTGLLIKGSAGTVTIPVAASSSTNVSANKLVGVTTNTTIDANTGYVLMASPSLGFYKNSKAFTVGANTAYLPADFAGISGARFFSLFNDDVTGINAVSGEGLVNGSVFDLQGRRVAQPQKGLYIVNGKKVVIK